MKHNNAIVLAAITFGLLFNSHFLAADIAESNKQVVNNGSSRPDAGKKVLIVGASYAKHWQIEEIAGHKVINRGVNGSESGPMLDRFKNDIEDVKPDVVIIWGFINDIFRSKPDMLDKKIEKTKDNFAAMIDLARRNGITPIVVTEVTITSKSSWIDRIKTVIGNMLGKTSYADYINRHVTEVNNWLKSHADEQKIEVLDFAKVLSNEDGERQREYAADDGSHLSEQAYDALTRYVQSVRLQGL